MANTIREPSAVPRFRFLPRHALPPTHGHTAPFRPIVYGNSCAEGNAAEGEATRNCAHYLPPLDDDGGRRRFSRRRAPAPRRGKEKEEEEEENGGIFRVGEVFLSSSSFAKVLLFGILVARHLNGHRATVVCLHVEIFFLEAGSAELYVDSF